MKTFATALTIMLATVAVGHAQSMNKGDDSKQQSPGTTGAMQNAPSNGVATDPGQVQAQQGDKAKSSPGTVGAAPGAATPSQKPGH